MGERDHSIECETCGESYGGFNDPSGDEHVCRDMVYAQTGPDTYEYRKRRFGECFCCAIEDGECACGGLYEQRVEDSAWHNLGTNLAIAGQLTWSWILGRTHGRLECDQTEGWQPNAHGDSAL